MRKTERWSKSKRERHRKDTESSVRVVLSQSPSLTLYTHTLTEFDLSVHSEEDVVGLYVSVDDLVSVQELQRLQTLHTQQQQQQE